MSFYILEQRSTFLDLIYNIYSAIAQLWLYCFETVILILFQHFKIECYAKIFRVCIPERIYRWNQCTTWRESHHRGMWLSLSRHHWHHTIGQLPWLWANGPNGLGPQTRHDPRQYHPIRLRLDYTGRRNGTILCRTMDLDKMQNICFIGWSK